MKMNRIKMLSSQTKHKLIRRDCWTYDLDVTIQYLWKTQNLYVCTLLSSSYINSGMYNLVCRKWWWDFRFSWCRVWRWVFCDIVSCTLIEADQSFRGVSCLHHQGDKYSSPWWCINCVCRITHAV
jgi:hypothetical protein